MPAISRRPPRTCPASAWSAIDGNIATPTDQDLYRVCLAGGGTFSATTVGGTELDTQLFLFDADGLGVYGNDDSQATRQSHAARRARAHARGARRLPPRRSRPTTATRAAPGGRSSRPCAGVLGADRPRRRPAAVAAGSGASGDGGAYSIVLTGASCAPPDTTAPTVDLRSPLDGAEVAAGRRADGGLLLRRREGGSGLASCEGTCPTAGCSTPPSSARESVTVTARDNAGNETRRSRTPVTVVDATRARRRSR